MTIRARPTIVEAAPSDPVELELGPPLEQEFRDFTYIVAHDLAGSLRHVTAFAHLLAADLGDDLTDRQSAFVEHIQSAGAHCQQMTEQLLIYSRVQQKVLTRERQSADALVRTVLRQLSVEAGAVQADILVAPLGEIVGDPELLALAFRHLLDNAIKYRRPGTAPRIDVRAAHDKDAWRIRICDNGIGVEPGLGERAFRMFQRLRPEDGLQGVGAGLPIGRRIARRHGGELQFLDHAKGACVELALPKLSLDAARRRRRRPS